jgi:ribosomal-protein-alanine N-acetyltransferase
MRLDAAAVSDFYQNLPRLVTKRLVLRKITKKDVPDIFAYASDPEVTRYLRWGPHQSLMETENYVNVVLDQYHEGRDGPWAIEHQRQQKVLGHIHLMDIEVQHRKARVGFVLSKSYWNRGIMTEALGKVLDYSFEELGLNRLEGLCASPNRAAIQVLGKVGMRVEGQLREYLFQKGSYLDFVICSLLRVEFEEKAS